MKKFLSILICCLLVSVNIQAWDALGHKIITEVAYNQLTKKARKQLDNILGKRGIIYYSSWADEIKSDTIYPRSFVHHYQNLADTLTYADLEYLWLNNKSEGEYAFYAIDSLVNVLKTDKTDADALKFVIHIMGDIFQPMHLARAKNRGGNRVQIRWFGKGINLHSLWDRWLLDYTQMSEWEYVRFLEDRYSDKKKEFQAMNMVDCLWMTYCLRVEIYAWQEKGDESNYHYAYRFRKDMDRNLYAAGVKLAQLLNEIYR